MLKKLFSVFIFFIFSFIMFSCSIRDESTNNPNTTLYKIYFVVDENLELIDEDHKLTDNSYIEIKYKSYYDIKNIKVRKENFVYENWLIKGTNIVFKQLGTFIEKNDIYLVPLISKRTMVSFKIDEKYTDIKIENRVFEKNEQYILPNIKMSLEDEYMFNGWKYNGKNLESTGTWNYDEEFIELEASFIAAWTKFY